MSLSSPALTRRILLVGLLLAPGLLAAAGDAAASDPMGLWWAEGGFAQVDVHPCDEASREVLCARVTWLRHPLDGDGCELRDVENPDESLRDRPVAGLEILRGLRAARDDPEEWAGGRIYDPSSGRTYSAVARMEGPDRLSVRGYFGIRLLGRTTTWIRVGSEDQCRQPA